MYCDALLSDLGCFLMQEGRIVAYSLCRLKPHEHKYATHDLELADLVFELKM